MIYIVVLPICMRKKLFKQLFPIFLTILTFFALSSILFYVISLLNLFPLQDKIVPHLHIADILVGLTIYIKTSVDFAIFIGNLMAKNPGWKNRIAIEIGTAFGNAAGTFFVLFIWTFFKEVPLLMVLMIFLASLVLFGMAEEGMEELLSLNRTLPHAIKNLAHGLLVVLQKINAPFKPLLHIILPHASTQTLGASSFLSLGIFAFTVPLILGLDDFAGYIPLFNVINVFGFAIGVFLGHMLLNVALFASPAKTTAIVRQPVIIFLGSFAFIGIALWGFWEIYHLLLHLYIH